MTDGTMVPKTSAGGAMTPAQLQMVDIAAQEGIPVSGLTILGGKPYINTTGLDVKLRSKAEKEKLLHVGTEYIPIQTAAKENGWRAGGWGIVKLFDKDGFEKALKEAGKGGSISKDVLDSLKEMYFHVFKMRGWASPETLGMESMRRPDHIEHMAERRATNRAKREATGTGLTSVDEMEPEATPTPQRASEAPSRPPQPPSQARTVPADVGRVTAMVARVDSRHVRFKGKDGQPAEGEVFKVILKDGMELGTWSVTFADIARTAIDQDIPVVINWKKNAKGYVEIDTIEPVENLQGDDIGDEGVPNE